MHSSTTWAVQTLEGGTEPVNSDGSQRQRVLVMDDEPMIREFIQQVFTTLGYEVEVTSQGEETIALYQQAFAAGLRFDLVILDLTVRAGLNGAETLEELWKIDPCVRAVATSGHANDPIMLDPPRYGFVASLKKPYRLAELQNLLDQLLPRGDTDSPTAFNHR